LPNPEDFSGTENTLGIDQFVVQHCTMIIPIEEKFVYDKL